ncbi:MAG: hypothetical protein WA655_02605 [Candidatus Korobacteraceae bacterium]
MIVSISISAIATTVVALIDKRHHRVVLADDSLIGLYYAKTTQTTCKLIVKPGCAFAMAGFLAKPDPSFRLQDLGEAACELPGSLKDKADGFLTLAAEPVNSMAQYLRENEPQFYGDTFKRNGGEFVYLVFAGVDNGIPVAYERGFKIAGDGTVNPVSNDITPAGATGFFAGFNDHIAAYLKAHPNWSHKDTVSTARKLVELEIAAHPDDVGPPISILTIDRKGKWKWVEAGVCPALPQNSKQEP